MRRIIITVGIPAFFAAVGAVSIGLWMRQIAALPSEEPRTPIEHTPLIRPPPQPAPATVPTPAPQPGPAAVRPAPAAAFEVVPGNWPCFRGPDRDNISKEAIRLNRDWEKNPPKKLWEITDLGEGYAAPAVADGRVFLMDYDQIGRMDNLRCFSFADGAPLWNYTYPVEVKRNHGMSRTVPAVSGPYVVSIGPMCHVNCLETESGRLLWAIDMAAHYGTTVPEWYAGQCPLIDDGRLILAPCGSNALMVAVNCADGRPAWTAPNPRRWAMSHSSVVPHIFKGRKMYVYASAGGIAAVNARDGTLLWEYDDWPRIITDIASPIAIAEDTLFVARGYEQGSMILRLRENGDGIGVEMAARLPRKVFGSDQHTPIFFEGRIYGARPPRGELVCLDPEGNPLWSSGTEGRFGIGGFTIADGIIFIMDDKANMTLADAVPGEYRQLSRLKVLDGHDTWGPVTVAGGRLLVRDTRTEKPNSSHLVCLDISAD